MSKIYVAQRTRSFNRLTNGPTWGINSASLALSNMAQRGRVDARTIRTELAQHPRLAIRLDKAGVDFLSLEQGTGADDIAAAFRFALYSGKKTQKLARLGFARDEEAVPFPISLSQLHWAVPGSASLEYLGGREGVTDLEQDLGIERSLASRVIDRLRLAYVIPTLICAGLSTLLFVTQGWVTDSFVLDKGLTDVANEDGVVGGGVGVAVGMGLGRVIEVHRFAARRNELTMEAMQVLREFSEEQGPIRAKQLARVKRILELFRKNERIDYLSTLEYRKITLFNWTEKYIVNKALVQCQDTPRGVLKTLAVSASREVKNLAFNRLALSLGTRELDEMAPRLTNVPALFDHPSATHSAKIAALRASLKNGYADALLEAFAPHMTVEDVETFYAELAIQAAGAATRSMGRGRERCHLEVITAIALGRTDTPLGILAQIAISDIRGVADQAMQRIIDGGNAGNINLKALRESPSHMVRLQAFFHDPASTAEELAGALTQYLPATERVVDDHIYETGPYGEDWSYDVTHQEFSEADVALASAFMRLRPRTEQSAIVEQLPTEVRRSSGPHPHSSTQTIPDDLGAKLRVALGL